MQTFVPEHRPGTLECSENTQARDLSEFKAHLEVKERLPEVTKYRFDQEVCSATSRRPIVQKFQNETSGVGLVDMFFLMPNTSGV
jgi:hypothetical protein